MNNIQYQGCSNENNVKQVQHYHNYSISRLDKPSVPLKAIGDPGPPRWANKIVDAERKYILVACKYFFGAKNWEVQLNRPTCMTSWF